MCPARSSLAGLHLDMFNYAPLFHGITRSAPMRLKQIAPLRFAIPSSVIAVMMIVGAGLGGCRSTNDQSAAAPPPSQQQASQIRQQLMAQDPNALIGQVVDVLPESQMAAVGDVDVNRFKVRDTLVFIDGAKQPQS